MVCSYGFKAAGVGATCHCEQIKTMITMIVLISPLSFILLTHTLYASLTDEQADTVFSETSLLVLTYRGHVMPSIHVC